MASLTALLGVAAILVAGGNRADVPPKRTDAVTLAQAEPVVAPPKGDRLGKPVPVEVDGKPLATWGTPFVGDFDGDGLPDLLLGYGQDGRLQVYRNIGTKAVPRLS